MTFISIAGNCQYINIMSDGLAVYENGYREHNWKKFQIFDNSRFVAFAGTIGACQMVLKKAEKELSLPYEEWIMTVKDFVEKGPIEKSGKVMICAGGGDQNLHFAGFSNRADFQQFEFKLENDSVNYAFLTSVQEEDLKKKFVSLAERYNSVKYRDILFAQKELNDYVSKIAPETVNDKISYYTLKREKDW